MNPSSRPSAAVVLPRFWPVAARYSWRTAGLAPRRRLALDQGHRVTDPGDRLGIDGIRLEIRPKPLHDVGHETQEDAGVGDEELRLVVVPDEREAALQD